MLFEWFSKTFWVVLIDVQFWIYCWKVPVVQWWGLFCVGWCLHISGILGKSGWHSRQQSSPRPSNTTITHPCVEQLSLQTNQRLTERHVHNQDCKRGAHKSGRKGRKAVRLGLCLLWRTQMRRGITQAQRFSLGSEQFELHFGHPSLRDWCQEDTSPCCC